MNKRIGGRHDNFVEKLMPGRTHGERVTQAGSTKRAVGGLVLAGVALFGANTLSERSLSRSRAPELIESAERTSTLNVWEGRDVNYMPGVVARVVGTTNSGGKVIIRIADPIIVEGGKIPGKEDLAAGVMGIVQKEGDIARPVLIGIYSMDSGSGDDSGGSRSGNFNVLSIKIGDEILSPAGNLALSSVDDYGMLASFSTPKFNGVVDKHTSTGNQGPPGVDGRFPKLNFGTAEISQI